MKDRVKDWRTSSPRPLLHKCGEEREKTRMVSLHEAAAGRGQGI